jgi:hypothetical protein
MTSFLFMTIVDAFAHAFALYPIDHSQMGAIAHSQGLARRDTNTGRDPSTHNFWRIYP